MTVSATTNKIVYQGNTATTSWSFTFPGVAASDVQIYITDSSGTITGPLASNLYSIVLNPAVAPNPTGIGGLVTYPLVGAPLAFGNFITIIRTLPLTQTTSLANQGTLYQPVIEAALDDLLMQIQQLNELLGRQITVAVSDSAPPDLPPAAQRANLTAIFDSAGNMTAGTALATGTVSAAMQPVINAATVANARTLLGLGAMALEGIGRGLQDDGAGNARVNFDIEAVAINTVLGAADHLQQYRATGPINMTLPKSSTVWNGYEVTIYSLTGAVTLLVDPADAFEGQAAGVSLVVPINVAVIVTTDGAGIWLVQWNTQPSGPIALPVQTRCQLTLSGPNLLLSRSAGTLLFINGANQQIPFAGVTLAPPATTNTTYYIYAYMVGSNMTMEYSATAYAVDATYGILIKNGDGTRTLVGMARTVGNAWVDSITQRFTRSYYNDPGAVTTSNFSANRSTASAALVELNTEIRNEFLVWTGESVSIASNPSVTNVTTNVATTSSIGIDGAVGEDVVSTGATVAGGSSTLPISGLTLYKTGLTEGYHFATLLAATAGGTTVFAGSASAVASRTTLRCSLRR